MAELGKTALFSGFDATITTNGNNEITGAILNAELKNIGDSYPNKLDEDHYFLRDYDTSRSYSTGFVCVQSDIIYRANKATSGTFIAADWDAISAGATTYLTLTDTPANYTGEANKLVRVNAAESGLEFSSISDLNGIYSGSGSLTGATVVTMATNNLQFDSTGISALFTIDATNDLIAINGQIEFDNTVQSTALSDKSSTAIISFLDTLHGGINELAITSDNGVFASGGMSIGDDFFYGQGKNSFISLDGSGGTNSNIIHIINNGITIGFDTGGNSTRIVFGPTALLFQFKAGSYNSYIQMTETVTEITWNNSLEGAGAKKGIISLNNTQINLQYDVTGLNNIHRINDSGHHFLSTSEGTSAEFLLETDIADTETCLVIKRNKASVFTAQQVSTGVTDSGGTGFKLLRIIN